MTAEQVSLVIELRAQGWTQLALAERFGVGRGKIRRIVPRGKVRSAIPMTLERAIALHLKRPAGSRRPCGRCSLPVKVQKGRRFCGGCSRNKGSRARWKRGHRSEWL